MSPVGDPARLSVTTDDGVALAVEVAGSGPGLLLVHGFGGAKEDFGDHVAALAATHTVVTFDHRGHGESDQPATVDAYSLARLRADVLAVADAVGLPTFRLLGHSMGGMVARRLPLDHPHRVEALVMMDTSPGPVPGFDPELVDIAATVAIDEGKDALKALLDAYPVLENEAYRRLVATRPGYEAFLARKWDALSEIMWAALARAIARQDDDLDAMAAGLACPLLVIVGELDEPLVAPSRAMAERVAHAELCVVPDAGHSPQFENPSAWRAALTGFLARLDEAAA